MAASDMRNRRHVQLLLTWNANTAHPLQTKMGRFTGKKCRLSCMFSLTFLFFLVEIVVGYTTNSVALIADSFHMLSDVLSIIIAFLSVQMSPKKWSKNTFGWARAEVLGALVNAVFLLALCFSIMVESIKRFYLHDEIHNPKLILVVGVLGLIMNIIGLFLFHRGALNIRNRQHQTTLTRFRTGHLKPLKIENNNKIYPTCPKCSLAPAAPDHILACIRCTKQDLWERPLLIIKQLEEHELMEFIQYELATSDMRNRHLVQPFLTDPVFLDQEPLHEHGAGHGHRHGPHRSLPTIEEVMAEEDINDNQESYRLSDSLPPPVVASGHHHAQVASSSHLNMRGVFLHVLADALGSVIVIISALIIWLSDWQYKYYVDPALSIMMVCIIMRTTWPLLVDAGLILLQTVPTHIQIDSLQKKLLKDIDGVLAVHEFHVWQLAGDRIIASAHIRCRNLSDYMKIAEKVKEFFHNEGIHSTTIQPEFVEFEELQTKMGRFTGKKCRLSCMFSLTFLFFLVEIVVGYTTNSVALIADSFHMLSDVLSIIIAFLSVQMSPKKWSKNTFGWARAEVLGALVNAVFLLALCFSIMVESIKRFYLHDEIHNPKLILVVGVLGLIMNIIGLFLFHQHGAGHGHRHGPHRSLPTIEEVMAEEDINDNQESYRLSDSLPPPVVASGHHHAQVASSSHLNMRGVFLHVLADALGSVIVIISALIIWLSDWQYKYYVDPALSIMMVCIIMRTTWPLLVDAGLILLQTVPTHIQIDSLQKKLLKDIDGVLAVHEFHVWQLAGDRIIASAHIRCRNLSDYMKIAEKVKEFFHNEGIHSTTIQPEFVEFEEQPNQETGEDCVLDCPASTNCQAQTCCGMQKDSPKSSPNSCRQRLNGNPASLGAGEEISLSIETGPNLVMKHCSSD
ncbi:SLC30A1 [Cordylochernes scorpioides]|uniref:SLC30A1 n=1 Tax=Cordylochernes scorpioides TaxID=51811 RepID=A0ABY6L5V3_9ARAC|nr:SLC30A1 [Cordylochernes scorpioides]